MSADSPKELIFEEDSRVLLLKGITKLADVVACTLGPKGRNIGLEKSWGAPSITNDGSTIVKEISLLNQYENMGVSIAKEVVQKTKESCGDGTTRATLLLAAMVSNGIKQISSGINPTQLKRGMDKAVEAIIKTLEKTAIAIKSPTEIQNIATVSASGNAEIGKIIAEAVAKAGPNGVITIEEAKGTTTIIEKTEGMEFDRGYLSAYFCTNSDKMTVELENPQILLVDRKISNVHDILPILQASASTARALLIIAEDIEGDALSTLVVNKLRGTLKVAAIKAPGFGDRRKAMMEDLAVLTGAIVISEDAGIALKEADTHHLGSAERISITKENTTIVNGSGQHDRIAARIKQIEHEITNTTNDYDKKKLEERKAKLSGGVAVIRVGALTESELKQQKSMYEDSLNSTRAALQEGVVPGGGIALLQARKEIEKLNLKGDELLGAKIVYQACEAPFKQIVANSGHDGSVLIYELESKPANFGFNVLTEKVENLIESGVIDPAKVVKRSLIHAASSAGIILLTEVLIGKAPEDDEE
ncbi:MAG: chaperonin GroEL [Parachlamydiales bacterium]|jgi:chaperonin GroEL